MRTLLAARAGVVEHAATFGGGDLDRPVPVHSITKSVLSTPAGLAWDRGLVELEPLLPLLTMTRGAQVRDMEEIEPLPGSWREPLLAVPQLDPPGTTFRYDNAAARLAALALHDAVGDLAAFAGEALFAPLGITRYRWATDATGHLRGDWAWSARRATWCGSARSGSRPRSFPSATPSAR